MGFNSRSKRWTWETSQTMEPQQVARWRRYADPINQALMEKWRNGEPESRRIEPDSRPRCDHSVPQGVYCRYCEYSDV
jgi:hypothetical protein